jgi:hypothetical protein
MRSQGDLPSCSRVLAAFLGMILLNGADLAAAQTDSRRRETGFRHLRLPYLRLLVSFDGTNGTHPNLSTVQARTGISLGGLPSAENIVKACCSICPQVEVSPQFTVFARNRDVPTATSGPWGAACVGYGSPFALSEGSFCSDGVEYHLLRQHIKRFATFLLGTPANIESLS